MGSLKNEARFLAAQETSSTVREMTSLPINSSRTFVDFWFSEAATGEIISTAGAIMNSSIFFFFLSPLLTFFLGEEGGSLSNEVRSLTEYYC